MERWVGRVAVVTGASSGIGADISIALVKQGMKVVGVARRLEKLQELEQKLADDSGTFHPIQGDVTSEEDIENIFSWVKENLGTVDVLINNAGIFRPGRLSEQDPKYLKETINVNLIGLLFCTQKAVAMMKEDNVEDGIIILVNSVMGHQILAMGPVPAYGAYPITKHGITAAAEILRQELWFQRLNIRVTSISPGYVTTELAIAGATAVNEEEEMSGFDQEGFAQDLHALEGEDVADVVTFVLSTHPRVQIHEVLFKAVGDTMINKPPV